MSIISAVVADRVSDDIMRHDLEAMLQEKAEAAREEEELRAWAEEQDTLEFYFDDVFGIDDDVDEDVDDTSDYDYDYWYDQHYDDVLDDPRDSCLGMTIAEVVMDFEIEDLWRQHELDQMGGLEDDLEPEEDFQEIVNRQFRGDDRQVLTEEDDSWWILHDLHLEVEEEPLFRLPRRKPKSSKRGWTGRNNKRNHRRTNRRRAKGNPSGCKVWIETRLTSRGYRIKFSDVEASQKEEEAQFLQLPLSKTKEVKIDDVAALCASNEDVLDWESHRLYQEEMSLMGWEDDSSEPEQLTFESEPAPTLDSIVVEVAEHFAEMNSQVSLAVRAAEEMQGNRRNPIPAEYYEIPFEDDYERGMYPATVLHDSLPLVWQKGGEE